MKKNEYINVSNRGKFSLTEKGIKYCYEKIIEEGLSFAKLGKEIGVNPDTIGKLCKENGVYKDNRRKYLLNENYFSIIDTPQKAYWLGFLSADGYISEDNGVVTIRLQHKDRSHLESFLKNIESSKKVKAIKINLDGKEHLQSGVSVNSRKMVNDLVSHGCYQGKSLTLKPPSFLKEDSLIDAWILGYYDGDGGISVYDSPYGRRFISYFTGTYEVISFIKEKYSLGQKILREHNCEHNTFKIQLTEGPTIDTLSRLYVSELDEVVLKRKHEIFKSVKPPC